MNNLVVFNELHQYLMLFQVRCTLAEKNLILGYNPFSFMGIQAKFAT